MKYISLVLLCSILTLTACQGVKDQLGLTRRSPDASLVAPRAPLALPPDFSLRPPQPGAPRPQDQTPTEMAKQAIGITPDRQGDVSAAEELLLQKTQVESAAPNIRRLLDEDRQNQQTPIGKRLLGIGKQDSSATVIDAEAEAKRIRAQQQAGKPITSSPDTVQKD